MKYKSDTARIEEFRKKFNKLSLTRNGTAMKSISGRYLYDPISSKPQYLDEWIEYFMLKQFQEIRGDLIKQIKDAPMEFIDFHDMDMQDAVFVKQQDLLDVLASLGKKEEE